MEVLKWVGIGLLGLVTVGVLALAGIQLYTLIVGSPITIFGLVF